MPPPRCKPACREGQELESSPGARCVRAASACRLPGLLAVLQQVPHLSLDPCIS